MGIKGEMSATVCVTFTWDMYIYIYIWVVYSLCFFCCCLFITVTWWYVWCFEWASGNQEEVQACLVTLWLFIISCYSLYKTTLGLLCSWFECMCNLLIFFSIFKLLRYKEFKNIVRQLYHEFINSKIIYGLEVYGKTFKKIYPNAKLSKINYWNKSCALLSGHGLTFCTHYIISWRGKIYIK